MQVSRGYCLQQIDRLLERRGKILGRIGRVRTGRRRESLRFQVWTLDSMIGSLRTLIQTNDAMACGWKQGISHEMGLRSVDRT